MSRVPNQKETSTTRYEEWFGKRPSVEHQHRKNFVPKARKVMDYGPIFDTHKHRVDEVTDVKFNESLPKRRVLIDGEEEGWIQIDDKCDADFLAMDASDDEACRKRDPDDFLEAKTRKRCTSP
ncbi:hypothetical protein T11_4743 [Trichinella zimbabwensis]|uniref:Uncharacterized protein n=1 Tax=Trichinella zimbabwensis TaxID=268475 RepID=A0A0V1I4G3_9BILA|nr:hypothetical protein T11_4743 [Trichinella zimbabwensis]